MKCRKDAPAYKSFVSILNDSGYESSFFYGGWYGFDDMDIFAKRCGMDLYFKKAEYDSVSDRNQWGLHDGFVLQESLKSIDKQDGKPYFHFYLTLTTHDPFDFPDADKYLSRLDERFAKIKVNKKGLASFLYIDDCLKNFFKAYEKKASYKNTIFVITGDHSFWQSKDRFIDNIHVPLIIFSPMLKQGQRFASLETHRNVSPSILAILRNNFGVKIPEHTHTLNHGLDTSKNFEAKTFSPLYDCGRNFKGIMYKEYFVTKTSVQKFTIKNKRLEIQNAKTDSSLMKICDLYLQLDNYIMTNDALE
ncbi:MAG: LTA synthase family protein [Bacteroidales bacterium]|nr:LTA synthase family protein [Bacteroidales bacterium]